MNNEYIYEEQKVGRYTVKVVNDDDPMHPRKDWDNIATMTCFHRNYNLGDDHNMDTDDLEALCKQKDIYSLPLYLYDHSGITMNTTGFSCGWDSGQVGRIYMSKETYLKNFGGKIITKKAKAKIYEILRLEVKEYDDYLRGNVYGFKIEDATGEVVDSCWSFYGGSKYCLEEGISSAKATIRYDIKQHIKQVKLWIMNHVPLEKRTGLPVC